MKRRINVYQYLLFSVFLLVISSCSQSLSFDWSQVDTFTTPHTLELPLSAFKFRDGQGGTQKFAINSNISWEITDLPDWLTVDKQKGTGGDSILLTCLANPSPMDARNAYFTVCSAVEDWDYSIPVTVSQVRALGFAASDTSEVIFKSREGKQTISITSNVEDWTVSVSPIEKGEPTDWLSARKSEDNKAVEISVVLNEGLRRQAYVVLKTKDSETKMTVTQKSLLDISPMNVSLPSLGNKTVTISVDTESPFDIVNSSDWLTVDNVTKNGFTIKASPNLSVARTAVIKVVMIGQLDVFLHRELTVYQADPYNGHAYVDLGLPSGLYWATCNVGANSPEEYGDYFAWGETTPKDFYAWVTYDFWAGGDSINHNIKFTKYNFSDSRILDLYDDAAQENWGGIWRIPTEEELDELRFNCTWTWTRRGSQYGYKVASKSNDNSIFLPAAGYRYLKSLFDADTGGFYWTSTQITTYKDEAFILYFLDILAGSYLPMNSQFRRNGCSVRPVCPGGFCSTD